MEKSYLPNLNSDLQLHGNCKEYMLNLRLRGKRSLQAVRQQSIPIVRPIRHQIQRPKISHLTLPSPDIHSLYSSSPFLTLKASGCTGMRAISTATPQRGGGGENDVVSEHHIEELPCALTGAWSVSSKVIRSRLCHQYKKLASQEWKSKDIVFLFIQTLSQN
ncbi:Hypothetical predicted protein [Prunus dulcis]|uniref:Uncharacterized protein n=1 Tax=Prunus dulcis TaxID=3755 RepID=A0A5E4FNH5_PRUDU|nr:Hypothetical predicted protein [Prunus dulcis]